MNGFNHTVRKPLVLNMYSINALRYLEVSIFTCKGKKCAVMGKPLWHSSNFKFDKTYFDESKIDECHLKICRGKMNRVCRRKIIRLCNL